MVKKNERNNTRAKAPARPERASFQGYVNVQLTEADRSDYDIWAVDSDLVAETYVEALASSYQFTSKFDDANDAYSCSVSSWDANKSDAGIIYTGRARTPADALQKCLYVLSRKLNWDMWNGSVKTGFHDAF